MITVVYLGDGYNSANSTTAKLTVNKINSTLTVNDIVFDYNNAGSTAVSYTGAWGVSAEVINQPKAIVNVKDKSIEVLF